MNKSFKVIWSKVRGCYVVASELAKNAVVAIAVVGGVIAGPQTVLAAIDGVNTFVETGNTNIKIGNNISLRNNSVNNGAVAIGDNVQIDDYVMQKGSIAIGQNAFVENMWGSQERTFAFGQTDSTLYPAGIAIGQNTYSRSGSVMIGDHKYSGALGDITVSGATADVKNKDLNIYATTIGANSYNQGQFSTVTGAFSVASGGMTSQNFGATITGSLNSIESATANSSFTSMLYSGVADSIVGTANKVANSNGALVFGAGNTISNSIDTISVPSSSLSSADDLQEKLIEAVRSSNGGGATLAIGGGNSADYTQTSQLIGVNNTLKGASGSVSKYNMIDGYKNTADNVNNVSVVGSNNSVSSTNTAVVLGDNRTLTGASNSVVIGSSASGLTTNVGNAVAIGSETNVTENGGVALGSSSVASTAAGKRGYDPSTKSASAQATSTWQATNAAVSVGDGTTVTRQITSVAAGTNDTDAVNVAQLKAAISGTAGSGGTTYTAGDNITIDNNVISAKDTRNTVVAGDNTTVDETKNSDGSSNYKVNVKTDGKVESGNTGIVTGGTVYNETRVTNNGSYIKSDNTAGQNLSVLDTQVKTNADNISNLDNRVSNMGSSISKLGNRLDKVGAGAAALAALHPMDFDENNKLTFAAGLGNYRSQNAAAIGAFYRPDDWVMFSVGGAVGNGENMVNLGVSFALDRKTGAKNLNKTQSSQKIAELENKIQQQDQMMASMQQQMAAMQETINRLTSK